MQVYECGLRTNGSLSPPHVLDDGVTGNELQKLQSMSILLTFDASYGPRP